MGYEGLVGEDDASPYIGGRTLSWLKVKQPDYRVGCLGHTGNRPADVPQSRGDYPIRFPAE